ncbi:MAG: N-acetyltransferase [Bacteroidetes bacterium]|nr:N-acetyltransferase [Bacteroidota bacterium]
MDHKLYPNVQIGKNAVIEDYVIIGVPPRGKKPGELPTVIGDDAVIRSHTVIYAGNKIGKNFQTGHHVLVREENEFGDNVSIGSSSVVEHHIRMGNNVRIHSLAFVPEMSILEDGAWIGPHAVITNAAYPLSPNVKNELRGGRRKCDAVTQSDDRRERPRRRRSSGDQGCPGKQSCGREPCKGHQ